MIPSVFESFDDRPTDVFVDLMKRDSRSRAELTELLTNTAIENGFVGPREPVPGLALVEWNKEKKAPMWARRAALELLIAHGWTPTTAKEWARFAKLWVQRQRRANLERLLEELPSGFDPVMAQAWLLAALESDRLFRANKQIKEGKARG
ncbi:hypothetical protein [Ferrimonas marina]|uniref:Uncharacterized protein n=1 Tax=Ferrimonas marina TaxID=299255 RepID=A0A1M5XAV8_9GAMM|nr:hypothetical protein [Ferrimonas marina]SHH96960.1 hypothetical protein SAMN02745129_3395 [Ferrimonas marina]